MKCFNTLTGFKYIAEVIKANEDSLSFLAGAEESYGYLIGDAVRDKDAIGSVAMICELVAYAKFKGKSLFERLAEIYSEYGFYKESLISITKKGKKGAEEIAEMMKSLRENPPLEINGSKLAALKDYQALTEQKFPSGETSSLDFPTSNVLQFITEDGSKISARPSGTEPKIKFYFSVNEPLEKTEDYDKISDKLDAKIQGIIASMGLK